MASLKSFILDTSAYSSFVRGDERLRPWFTESHEIVVPLIVVGELRSGFAAGSHPEENEASLRRFLDAPNVTTLSLSMATTEEFARLFLQLRKAGIAVSTNDLWIATLAKEKGLPILTLDKDFGRIEGIEVVGVS